MGQSLKEYTSQLLSKPDTLENLCGHLAEGGSIVDWCKASAVRFADVFNWIYADPIRKKLYEASLAQQNNFVVDKLLHELRKISFFDIRKLYNDDGTIKPVSEWDADIASAIVGIKHAKHKTDKDGDEYEPETLEVKLADKLQAIALIGKNLRLFTDRIEHDHRVTLEDLVLGSQLKKVETIPAKRIEGGDPGVLMELPTGSATPICDEKIENEEKTQTAYLDEVGGGDIIDVEKLIPENFENKNSEKLIIDGEEIEI